MVKRLLLSFQFFPQDGNNAAFTRDLQQPRYRFVRELKDFFAARGVDVQTIDMVSKVDSYDFALFTDVSWRMALKDRNLWRVPREKRVLLLTEPSNINPAPYALPLMRKLFGTVFTWHETLLARFPSYVRVKALMGVDPRNYRTPSPQAPAFAQKRFLLGLNSNRWAYHPQSVYTFRKRIFRFFEEHTPGEFDLYGHGWNRPSIFYERWTGFPHFRNFRGAIPGDFDAKIPITEQYKYTLCIENNVVEPGYISEKSLDIMCARSVPIYYGWCGAKARLPEGTYINLRDFPDFDALLGFLRSIDEQRYQGYIDAINRYLASPEVEKLRDEQVYGIVYEKLFGQ